MKRFNKFFKDIMLSESVDELELLLKNWDELNESSAGNKNIIYRYSTTMPDEKISEFSANPEGCFIRVNSKHKDRFESFWKYHEIGHWEFFNKVVLPKIKKPVTDEKIDAELDRIRDEGYPDNEEERYAFKRQIEHLRSVGWSDDDIMDRFEEDYDLERPGHFKEAGFDKMLQRYIHQ